jgi:tetratricopeptide (TPR) repeat protein
MNTALNPPQELFVGGSLAPRTREDQGLRSCRRAKLFVQLPAPVFVLAMMILPPSCRAQKGRTLGPVRGAAGGPIMVSRVPPDGDDANSSSALQSSANNPSAKRGSGDESCLPWSVSADKGTAVSVASLTVPSSARSEYAKACEANNKNKFAEAELYTRSAIKKFQSYSAAWVMLGMVLEEQSKRPEALEACEHAVSVDSKYLPAYMCQAEFSARNREWEKVLGLANLTLSLNPAGDSYSYYYRATALFHLKDLAEAKKSALEASEQDTRRENVPLYFLLAQIYKAQGDRAEAAAQLRQILKLHLNQQEQVTARKMLDELGPQSESN